MIDYDIIIIGGGISGLICGYNLIRKFKNSNYRDKEL